MPESLRQLECILTKVLAIIQDAMKGAHGACLGVIRADWCSLWDTDRYDWHKPGWDKGKMIRCNLALGTDYDIQHHYVKS